MSEYIEREALLAEFVRMFKAGLISMEEDVEEVIEDFPAADVAPVVHGEWKYSHTDNMSGSFAVVKCSRCEYMAYAIAEYVKNGNFCPGCGAKMDGGKE